MVQLGEPIADSSFPTRVDLTGDFSRLLITFANSLDQDQDRRFVGPDLGPNCLQRLYVGHDLDPNRSTL